MARPVERWRTPNANVNDVPGQWKRKPANITGRITATNSGTALGSRGSGGTCAGGTILLSRQARDPSSAVAGTPGGVAWKRDWRTAMAGTVTARRARCQKLERPGGGANARQTRHPRKPADPAGKLDKNHYGAMQAGIKRGLSGWKAVGVAGKPAGGGGPERKARSLTPSVTPGADAGRPKQEARPRLAAPVKWRKRSGRGMR